MASVSIKYSQNVIDQLQALSSQGTSVNGSLDSLVDLFASAGAFAAPAVPVEAWSQFGSTVVVAYPDGSTESYMDVLFDDPAADSGHASASGYEFHEDGALTISATGHFNVDYTITPATPLYASTLSFAPAAAGSTLNYLRLATELASSDVNYDTTFGNATIVFDGALNLAADGDVSGIISRITTSSEKILASSTIDGVFQVDASLPSGIGGVVTGYHEQYYDGSQAQVGGVAMSIDPTQVIDLDMLTDPAYFGGSDDIGVDLPARLYAATTVTAGAGDDRVVLKGGGGLLGVAAGDGDDRITLQDGGHAVDGGSGLDTVVLAAARAGVGIARVAAADGHSAFTVTDASGAVDQLTDVERIVFADGAYALDIDGHAGQAYRLFQAAFDRAPDAAGLGFWIDALDVGQSLTNVAQGFVDSAEFQAAYGAAPAHGALVTQFYQNILHRTADAGGLAFWVNVLDSGAGGVADVLAAISESAENKAALVGVIGNGFEYTPYAHA